MLSLQSQQSTPAPLILDITLDNWSTFHQSFKLLCFTKFGVAGQQLRHTPYTIRNCPLQIRSRSY